MSGALPVCPDTISEIARMMLLRAFFMLSKTDPTVVAICVELLLNIAAKTFLANHTPRDFSILQRERNTT